MCFRYDAVSDNLRGGTGLFLDGPEEAALAE